MIYAALDYKDLPQDKQYKILEFRFEDYCVYAKTKYFWVSLPVELKELLLKYKCNWGFFPLLIWDSPYLIYTNWEEFNIADDTQKLIYLHNTGKVLFTVYNYLMFSY